MFSLKRLIIYVAFLLLVVCPVSAFEEGEHSNHLCYTIFGYIDDAAIQEALNPDRIPDYDKTEGGRTLRAYYIVKDAIAVAIDNKGTSSNSYTNIKQRLSFTPSLSDLKVHAKKHREACHQGFDYKYKSSMKKSNWDRLNARWLDVGRPFLIKAMKNAFSTDENTSTFIAMVAYYTHLIGDLAQGETGSMLELADFSKMASELEAKIKYYGNKLKHAEKIMLLCNEIKMVKATFVSGTVQDSAVRDYYSKLLLDALAEYVPSVIYSNLENPAYKFNMSGASENFTLR